MSDTLGEAASPEQSVLVQSLRMWFSKPPIEMGARDHVVIAAADEIERLEAALATCEAKLGAVRAIHTLHTEYVNTGDPNNPFDIVVVETCFHSGYSWPCPTIRALDGGPE